jgi:hypothetical protein
MTLDKDYEIQCKQVWIEAWVKTSQSANCTRVTTPTKYADECLSKFKERFKPDSDDHK